MLVLGPQRYFWVSIIASFTIVAPVFWISTIARTLVAPSWVQVGPRLLYWCRGCQGGPKFASSRSMPLRFIRNATPNHFGDPSEVKTKMPKDTVPKLTFGGPKLVPGLPKVYNWFEIVYFPLWWKTAYNEKGTEKRTWRTKRNTWTCSPILLHDIREN